MGSPAQRRILTFGLLGALGALSAALMIGEPLARLLLPGRQKVDVLFVLDVTGSMQGEIDGVRAGITEFVRQLQTRKLDSQVGLIAFRDRLQGEEPEVLTFPGPGGQAGVFTHDLEAFRSQVGSLTAAGGGDTAAESASDALVLAARQPFRSGSTRALILITDAPPLAPDRDTQTVEAAAQALVGSRVNQLHVVAPDMVLPLLAPLRSGGTLPGQDFPLETLPGKRQGFDQVLSTLGTAVASTALIEAPGAVPVPGQAPTPLERLRDFAGTAFWTGALGLGVFLALVLGQRHALHSRAPWTTTCAGALGSLAVGMIAGIVGQGILSGAQMAPLLATAGRGLAWGVLGAALGAGMGFFVPNLAKGRAAIGGLIGGIAAALGFWLLVLAGGDFVGRLGGAALLGFFIGLMVALVEVLFREAWLEVEYAPREIATVTLGAEPVSLGSDRDACTVFIHRAEPVSRRFWIDGGRIACDNVPQRRQIWVPPGYEDTVGGVRIRVRVPGAATARLSDPGNDLVLQLTGGNRVALAPGSQVSSMLIPGLASRGPGGIVAAVAPNPQDPTVLGLKNLSTQTWYLTVGNERKPVEPDRSLRLVPGVRVDFGTVQGEILVGR